MNDNMDTNSTLFVVSNDTETYQEASCEVRTDEIKQWSILEFDTDTEDDVERFKDLVPSKWISSNKTLCWYPIREHKSTIQKLTKQCAEANPKWNCFSMKVIEENIKNYDQGMRMLVKVCRDSNSTLYSDMEEKGKGKRIKKPKKQFDAEIIKKNKLDKRQSSIPPIPKFTSVTNISPLHLNENKENSLHLCKHSKKPLTDRQFDNIKEDSLHLCKHSKKPLTDRQFDNIKEDNVYNMNKKGRNIEEFSSIKKKGLCKMNPKAVHKCAYGSDGTVSLESIADAICFLSSELSLCKSLLRKTDKTMETFVESEVTTNKNASIKQSQPENPESYLDEFPLSTLDQLKAVERKFKKDDSYRSKIINALHVGSTGDSAQKKINSMLRMVFHDNLAVSFNWKGQRGKKEKLCDRRISKVMIEAIMKTYPSMNTILFGRKAGPWLAQAAFRLKKTNKEDNKETSESEASDVSDVSDAKDANDANDASDASDASNSDASNPSIKN